MLKAAQEGITQATTGIVSGVVLSIWESLKLKYNEIMVPTPEHFLKNTLDSYERCAKIKCLARGQLIMPLKDIYVPLTLCYSKEQTDVSYVADRYDPAFFNEQKQVLIVDTAGMGKSTVVKRLYIDIVESGSGIPIFVELRRLSSTHSIIDEIHSQISFLDKEFSLELLYSFIKDGRFIVILDGYDEISFSEKSKVTTALQDFINHAGENVFIMTSRQEQALSSFEGFQTFNIQPLSKDDAFVLLEKYDDDDKETSTLLISTLKKTNSFDEFLGNPLLTSMLLTAFTFKNEIPNQKHIFYRNVFDAFFNRHDLTKGGAYQHEKHSGLGIEAFHRVLRHMGIISLKKERIEFDKDDLIDTIEQALKLCSENSCSAGDFFLDIIEVVPLFVQDGIYYRWAHKSIYEYFAAQNIYRDIPNKEKLLRSMSSDERIDKYYNLLDLYYEIDYSTFRRCVIYDLLSEIVDYIEKGGDPLSLDIIRRRQCTFSCKEYYLIRMDTYSERSFGKVAQKVHEETHLGSLMYTHNSEKTLFLFRKMDDCPRERLVLLLYNKKYPCFANVNHSPSLSSVGLVSNQIYMVDDNPSHDGENGLTITVLLESLEPFIDYHKAKDELKNIEDDNKTVLAFVEGLLE